MCVDDYLSMADGFRKGGNLDTSLMMYHLLENLAIEKKDYILRDEARRKINKYEYKLEEFRYDETGAASPSNREPRSLELPKGAHKAYPVIKSGGDPYRMSQVSDLYMKMKTQKLIDVDQRDFINNFTKGETTSLIKWIGKKNILHYIIYEWKTRSYIPFEPSDDIWIITSHIFINGKKLNNDNPTPFYADDLRTTHNPKTIPQDIEDIVEILNPKKPSKNYKEESEKAENRVMYTVNQRKKKKGKMKGHDVFENMYADIEEE